MVEAYVTIRTDASTTPKIIEAIRDIDRVKQASIVAGEFDIIAEVEAES